MAGKIIANSNIVISEDGTSRDFRVEGNTRSSLFFVDGSADRIGINTAAPEALLHIQDTDSTRPVLMLQGGGDTAGDLVVPHDEKLQIGHWNESTQTFDRRLQMDTAGNIGIGMAAGTPTLSVNQGSSTGYNTGLLLHSTSSGASTAPDLTLDRDSASPADYDYLGALHFYGRNTADETILYANVAAKTRDVTDGTEDGQLRFGTMHGGSFADKAGVHNNGAFITETGIYFTDNVDSVGSANLLDDYEEGTWTVNMYDAASGGNASSTTVTGRYTKIGNLVTARFDAFNNISTAGLTGGNVAYFSLPFAASTTGRSCGTVQTDGVAFNSRTMVSCNVSDSASRAQLKPTGSGTTDSTCSVSDFNGTTSDIVNFCLTYVVD